MGLSWLQRWRRCRERWPERQRDGVERAERWQALDQRGATVWLTGLPSAHKSRIAAAVEALLITMYLDRAQRRNPREGSSSSIVVAEFPEAAERSYRVPDLIASATSTVSLVTTRKLSEIAPDLWITEQPLRYLGFEAGRRMAVIRLADGGLLIHSPARLSPELRAALDQLGDVRFVVPASELHGHLYMEQYRDAYPHVKLFAAPGLLRKRKDLRFDGLLSGEPEPEWRGELDQMAFEGWRRLNEIEFFHPKTRTLITGDLCCNFGLMTRLVAQGRVRRHLGPPTECRTLGIFRDRLAVQRSLVRILEWDFERILPGHGEIVHTGGKDTFEKDFARLLR